jgi:hypothetical protein
MLNTPNLLNKVGPGQFRILIEEPTGQREVASTPTKQEKGQEGIAYDESIDQALMSLRPYQLVLYPRHNLPQKLGSLLGCDREIDRVLRGWEESFPAVMIRSGAGTGKTRLAIEIAYACLQRPYGTSRSPDDLQRLIRFNHAVWLSARDERKQKLSLDEVLDTIGVVTDFPSVCKRRRERKKEEISRILQAYRVLIVIDNFEAVADQELIDWLTQVPDPSKVLLTSSVRKISGRGVCEVNLAS